MSSTLTVRQLNSLGLEFAKDGVDIYTPEGRVSQRVITKLPIAEASCFSCASKGIVTTFTKGMEVKLWKKSEDAEIDADTLRVYCPVCPKAPRRGRKARRYSSKRSARVADAKKLAVTQPKAASQPKAAPKPTASLSEIEAVIAAAKLHGAKAVIVW